MARGVRFDVSGLSRVATFVATAPERARKIRERAVVTLMRRLRAEAARKISEVQLNVRPRALAPLLSVTRGTVDGDEYVALSAANTRIPIALFRPSVSKRSGVRVTIWHHRGVQHWQHAFRPKGERTIKQRIPGDGPSGLVSRLPITTRVGPSLARTLRPIGKYADDPGRKEVIDHVTRFGQVTLSDEIRRLLALRGR